MIKETRMRRQSIREVLDNLFIDARKTDSFSVIRLAESR